MVGQPGRGVVSLRPVPESGPAAPAAVRGEGRHQVGAAGRQQAPALPARTRPEGSPVALCGVRAGGEPPTGLGEVGQDAFPVVLVARTAQRGVQALDLRDGRSDVQIGAADRRHPASRHLMPPRK
ncbi:hypothetical protein P354_20595 [Streptomyces noursei PD-1]|nr:hypothetical protein P354_20595 [Streptomyces noursei PD-1]